MKDRNVTRTITPQKMFGKNTRNMRTIIEDLKKEKDEKSKKRISKPKTKLPTRCSSKKKIFAKYSAVYLAYLPINTFSRTGLLTDEWMYERIF